MTRSVCAVKRCRNTSYGSKLTFFKFPKDPVRFVQWADLCQRSDILENIGGNYWLCETHFDSSQTTGDTKKTLISCSALPNINLPPEVVVKIRYGRRRKNQDKIKNTKKNKPTARATGNTRNEIVVDLTNDEPKPSTSQETITGSQSNEQDENSSLTVRTRKTLLPTFERLCDEFLPHDIARFIKTRAKIITNNKNDPDLQKFYLQLYLTHPQAYASLQNELSFPSKTELINRYAPLLTADRKTVLEVLKMKVQCMQQAEKFCALLVRRVPITPYLFYNQRQDKIRGFHEVNGQQSTQVAKYAVIAMVRGINEGWCLPIDYALLYKKNHSDIRRWFRSVIAQLLALGLDVIVCISNIIPQLCNKISSSKPYLIHGTKKIFFMYNPDYLIFQVKRLLMRFQLHFKGLETNWEHVLKFYEMDSKKELRLAPHLTGEHMVIGNEPQAKKLTKEVLNEQVAAAISAYVDFGQIQESARGTVHFISTMAKLINFLQTNPENKTNKQISKTQENIVKEVYKMFEGLKVFNQDENITSQVKLIERVLLSLKTIEAMDYGLKYTVSTELPKKFLSMDILNKFVLNVRKKSKARRLTSLSLIRAYRRKFCCKIMKSDVKIEENLIENLAKYCHKVLAATEEIVPEVTKRDLTNLAIPKKHQFLFVCGLVFKKTYEIHKECAEASKYFTFDESNEDNYGIYLEYREVCTEPLPMIPPDSFVVFLQKVEAELQKFIRLEVFFNGEARQIVSRIISKLETIQLKGPCPCFPEPYVLQLYIRIRLVHLLSMNNEDYRTQPLNDATFRVKYFV